MNNTSWLYAVSLDGTGKGAGLNLDEANNFSKEDGLLWVHLNYNSEESHRWLAEKSGLDSVVIESLTEQETRPRWYSKNNGLLVILRGVNLNPDSNPEDMVSIRLWIEPLKIISVRHRNLLAVEDIKNALQQGNGPENAGEFLTDLINNLSVRMAKVIEELDNFVDNLEDNSIIHGRYDLRKEIANVRRKVIALKRYLYPQRDVLLSLQSAKVDWLDELARSRIRESSDRITRFIENLDEIRDRTTVVKEQTETRLAEQMNKAMYIISIITAIFLPLGFITGLLGINVGGIPGAESHAGFVNVCTMLLVLAAIQIIIFKKIRWL